jgi:hypothetical protein
MSIEILREQVLAANRHEGGLKIQPCLAVEPGWFAEMQADVRKLLQEREASDVMLKSHPSNWVRPFGQGATQHSLFNKSGITSDYSSDHSGATEGLALAVPGCESLKHFFAPFESRLISLRLNGLMPGSGLGAHEEAIVKGKQVRLRFHLPVLTNPGASLLVDDEKFRFREGYVYFFNNGCVHSAVNEGTTDRYHFVWDMWLDEWIYENILNLESPASPGPRLRKLTRDEAIELGRGEDCPVEEYIIGTATGELIFARKQRKQNGAVALLKQMRLHEGFDIASENTALGLGEGWYGLEHFEGERFRWVNNNAVIMIAAAEDGNARVSMEVEPGPSMGGGPLLLKVLDNFGCEIETLEVHSRQRVEFYLPVHGGQTNTFQLNAEGGGTPVPGDPRLLNFRVFRIDSEI